MQISSKKKKISKINRNENHFPLFQPVLIDVQKYQRSILGYVVLAVQVLYNICGPAALTALRAKFCLRAMVWHPSCRSWRGDKPYQQQRRWPKSIVWRAGPLQKSDSRRALTTATVFFSLLPPQESLFTLLQCGEQQHVSCFGCLSQVLDWVWSRETGLNRLGGSFLRFSVCFFLKSLQWFTLLTHSHPGLTIQFLWRGMCQRDNESHTKHSCFSFFFRLVSVLTQEWRFPIREACKFSPMAKRRGLADETGCNVFCFFLKCCCWKGKQSARAETRSHA